MDPLRIRRIITKLESAWNAAPHLALGPLIEQVEDIAWSRYTALTQRTCSPRMSNLDDSALEWALNEWLKEHAEAGVSGWKS